jgi:cell division protein ZapA
MSQKTNQVEVSLLGKTHQFACTEGQEAALLDAAALLNSTVEEMKQRSTIRNEHNALLMAALHLCHDLQAQKTTQESLITKLTTHLDSNQK